MALSPSEIVEIARRQLADYDAHRPGSIFEHSSISLTAAEAYQVQKQVAALRVARGESIAGYKIGCLSDAVQRQLGLDQPVFGHVFSSEVVRSGAEIRAAAFDGLAVEGEFAVRVAVDVPGPAFLRESSEEAVADVFPVIELHNYTFRGAAPSGPELIANNALHAGVVLPATEGNLRDAGEIMGESISVFRSGRLLGTSTGSSIPGGPLASLIRVAEHLASCGEILERGQIVLTGSPLPLYAAGPGDRIVVSCPRLGDVVAVVQ